MKGRAASKRVRAFLIALIIWLPLFATCIHSTRADVGIIHIRGDGEIYPATASISTLDNVTYVFTDNIINMSISIERSGITLDGRMHLLYGTGSGNGISIASIQGVTIKNINISGFSAGIQLSLSSMNNTIENNIIHSNVGGIIVDSSSDNEILGNTLFSNSRGGLSLLEQSTANEVMENNITSNGYWSIYCSSSSNNYIYHNMIFTNPVGLFEQSVDTWDNGYPSGGNYWGFYSGSDLYSGPYQNVTGSDGIGDIPVILDSNNRDNYPLMTTVEALHNIAVTQVTPWQYLVGRGQLLNVSVSVQNTGIYIETFNLTLAVNATTLETRTLTLSGLSSSNSTFSWNTTDSATGTYIFKATADQVPGESNITDNVLTSGIVTLFATQLQVDPPSISVQIGQIFCVDATLTSVYNLTAWQFRLFFNSTVLNCTGVSEGPFLQSAGNTFFTWNINNAYNATHGCILVGCSLTGQTSSASGNGALANITFSTLTPGSTILHLANTELDDNNFPPNQIPSTNSDGFTKVTEAGIEVDPSPFVAPLDNDVYVNITLTDIYNLTAWQFGLFFDSTVLNCTGVSEGPFLQSAGNTIFTRTINNEYNATTGYILVGCSLFGQNSWISGNGTIATIEFTSLNIGNTSLHFVATEFDDNSFPLRQISCILNDGFVKVALDVHDLAVDNVAPYKTIVGRTFLENVTVTMENLGVFIETFNITLYANDSVIDVETVTLTGANVATLTFPWNASGFTYGNYTLSAYITPVNGENDTANNLFTDGTVRIVMAGDIREPFGRIDMRDIAYVARRFLVRPTNPLWDPNADINSDGKIDMTDIAIVARNFGVTY